MMTDSTIWSATTSTRLGAALLLLVVAGCNCGEDGFSSLRPVINAEPNPIDFGTAYVGVGATVFLQVKNTGSAQLDVSGVRVEDGTHPGVSVMADSFSLAPGETQAVTVRFVPAEVGPAYGVVLLDSNDPVNPVLEVPIAGQGERRIGPVMAVCVEGAGIESACEDPLRIDFGVVPFGTTVEAAILVKSTGTLPLETSAALEAGGHPSITVEPNMWTESIAADSVKTLIVRFSPGVPEAVSAVYQVNSNDAERSFTPVIITGSGVAPTLCLSESIVDFGQVTIGQSVQRMVTLESCGSVAFDLTSLTIAMNPEFSVIMPPVLPQQLSPGQTVDVMLAYAPTTPGRDNDNLVIGSSLPDGFVALTGAAISCDLSVLPQRVNFNAVGTGRSASRSILVENSGGVDCQVTAAQIGVGSSSDFTLTMMPMFPATVAPGASIMLEVTYTPSDSGSDLGTVEIIGSDPGQPTLQVDLNGRRLGFGECALVVTPDPINFGSTTVGTSQTIQVDLHNDGTRLCTLGQVSLAATSARAYRLAGVTAPMLIRAGQSRTIDVIYAPTDAQPHTGELEIFAGLIPISVDFQIPISGFGAGPMLCPMPSPVVFGTHPASLVATRNLQLVSCGTQDIVISSLSLPSPTSGEFSITAPPTAPLTIAPGQQVNLALAYQGVDQGRDDGVIRLQSNDAASPTRDVALIAHTSPLPCGDIQGRLCGIRGNGPVEGATVYVQTATGRVQTTTDANGDWVLTCVPAGNHSVRAEFGSWSVTLNANVTPNTVTTFPGQQCLEPDSARVAVVYGEWDQIEDILDGLQVPYTFYSQGQASQLVGSAAEMAMYDIIFFNCGWEESAGLSGPGRANIASFVMNGGTVYASDWAYDLIEVSWPTFVDFDGDDTVIDAAEGAGPFNGPAFVRDFGLAAALQGRTQVTINSCCTAVSSAGMGTTAYLEADRLGDGVQRPLMLSFQPTMTSGKVWYTDFHNTGQADIAEIFDWLILNL